MAYDRDIWRRVKPPGDGKGKVLNFKLGKLAVVGLLVAVVCITVLMGEMFLGTVERVVPMLTAPVTSTIVRIKKKQHRTPKSPSPAGQSPGAER